MCPRSSIPTVTPIQLNITGSPQCCPNFKCRGASSFETRREDVFVLPLSAGERPTEEGAVAHRGCDGGSEREQSELQNDRWLRAEPRWAQGSPPGHRPHTPEPRPRYSQPSLRHSVVFSWVCLRSLCVCVCETERKLVPSALSPSVPSILVGEPKPAQSSPHLSPVQPGVQTFQFSQSLHKPVWVRNFYVLTLDCMNGVTVVYFQVCWP